MDNFLNSFLKNLGIKGWDYCDASLYDSYNKIADYCDRIAESIAKLENEKEVKTDENDETNESLFRYSFTGNHTADEISDTVNKCLSNKTLNAVLDDDSVCSVSIDFPDDSVSFVYSWDADKKKFVGKQNGYDCELIQDTTDDENETICCKKETSADRLKKSIMKNKNNVVDKIFNAVKNIVENEESDWFENIYEDDEIKGISISSYALCNESDLNLKDIFAFVDDADYFNEVEKLGERIKKELGFSDVLFRKKDRMKLTHLYVELYF